LIWCLFKVNASAPYGSFSDVIIKGAQVDENATIQISTIPGKIIVNAVSILYGDVTGNKKIDGLDGDLILRYVVGSLFLPDPTLPNFTKTVADVSANGAITSYDAALVYQYSVGLITTFPVQKNQEGVELITPFPVHKNQGFAKPAMISSSSKVAELTLVLVQNDKSQTMYELKGSNLSGYVAGEFIVSYNPQAVNMAIGETNSELRTGTGGIESKLDTTKRIVKIAMTVNDDIDVDTSVCLFRIKVPPVTTANPENALVLDSALLNEGKIRVRLATGAGNPWKYGSQNLSMLSEEVLMQSNAEMLINNPNRLPVTLRMFDIKGREIYSESFPPINYSIKIRFNKLPSGLYVSRVNLGNRSIVKPFVLQ
jgi:hypothetical protein